MKPSRSTAFLSAVLAAALVLPTRAAGPSGDTRTALHVLNRLGFGPRPGDVERVQLMGLQAYIDDQLHPERIPDAGMSARLEGFETLSLRSEQIAERYERPAREARRVRQRDAASQPQTEPPPSEMRRANPEQRQAPLPLMELSQQKMLRAVYSERQLQEVLTDFWFNHFNVDARKGPTRFMLTEYERDTIRPHVLGRFRDLLEATAKSPAMLFYLDNWMSADPKGPNTDVQRAGVARGGFGGGQLRPRLRHRPDMTQAGQPRPSRPRGLNENYGRELLELHTLGVDGGYTQKDVTEVARAFTGWSILNPRQGGGFRFAPALHDDGEKVVLGRTIKSGGGERDGEQVLGILASHPATARFIATKLARRFVGDTPPPALVDRVAATFLRTDGDLRAVMKVLLTAPEFLAPESSPLKVKTPFEFIVSAVRATGAKVADARSLVRSMQELGMPLYQCQPPTGYKDVADAWVNTGALVARMNVALSLADNRLPGVHISGSAAPDDLLGVELSDATRATIAKAATRPQALALALGSPEFQRR